ANTELAFQNSEKEKRASELVITNFNLGEAKSNLKEHIQEIEEMMFITSHKVRQPIANILGLSDALELFAQSPEDLKESIRHIKKSALILEGYTKELTQYIEELKQNWKE
ncbi:MAG: diguanylate cyclase, partial [Bacteroidetes bacterium]|nr:diguanylate cyclase [Bacteroidota bacterium]MBU1761127.1 diguanylate cyclase [Bacteroidota bacterium]